MDFMIRRGRHSGRAAGDLTIEVNNRFLRFLQPMLDLCARQDEFVTADRSGLFEQAFDVCQEILELP